MLLGVDVGGTFTDAVLAVEGRLITAKAPTTPEDQSEGVLAAVRAVDRAAEHQVVAALLAVRRRLDRSHASADLAHCYVVARTQQSRDSRRRESGRRNAVKNCARPAADALHPW